MVTTGITLMKEYFDACCNGNLDRVKKCVEKGVDINGEYDQMSPFRIACSDNYQEIVKYLIEQGADVATSNKYNETGLIHSSSYGYTKTVELLLEQDSSTNFIRHQDAGGRTALMWAAKNGNEEVVKLLLFYDPSEEHVLIKDQGGKTAIDLAKTEVTEKIRELLRSPPEVQTKRAKQST